MTYRADLVVGANVAERFLQLDTSENEVRVTHPAADPGLLPLVRKLVGAAGGRGRARCESVLLPSPVGATVRPCEATASERNCSCSSQPELSGESGNPFVIVPCNVANRH